MGAYSSIFIDNSAKRTLGAKLFFSLKTRRSTHGVKPHSPRHADWGDTHRIAEITTKGPVETPQAPVACKPCCDDKRSAGFVSHGG